MKPQQGKYRVLNSFTYVDIHEGGAGTTSVIIISYGRMTLWVKCILDALVSHFQTCRRCSSLMRSDGLVTRWRIEDPGLSCMPDFLLASETE